MLNATPGPFPCARHYWQSASGANLRKTTTKGSKVNCGEESHEQEIFKLHLKSSTGKHFDYFLDKSLLVEYAKAR